jgi:hypothetical protein
MDTVTIMINKLIVRQEQDRSLAQWQVLKHTHKAKTNSLF